MNLQETSGLNIEGHIKIWDPESDTIYVNKRNAIHYEHFTLSLGELISYGNIGFIKSLCFGNGGTIIDPTGIITYLTPNAFGTNAELYRQTYEKVVNTSLTTNTDPTRNYIEVRHNTGLRYTDVLVTCLLDYGEPDGQAAYDSIQNPKSDFVFDEIGLRSHSTTGTGRLLTHVIFHPVQKSANRLIQIDYTIRIMAASGL